MHFKCSLTGQIIIKKKVCDDIVERGTDIENELMEI